MKRKALLILLISILALTAAIFFGLKKEKDVFLPETIQQHSDFPAPVLEYGIPVDSFNISTHTIRLNQTLGGIMESHGIELQYIQQLPVTTKDGFDIRKIRAGNRYKLFTTLEPNPRVEFMVYEHTQIDYVVFHFTDSLTITVREHEIRPITRVSEAEITSSLWEAMGNNNINPILALDLSDIFAWTVDFFGLDKGDRFKAIYDEHFIGDKSVGIGNIHAAWFEHKGEKFYAFHYMQDSIWSYWDEIGNSLRKTFLKAPLRFSRISSGFTHRRFHPILKIYRPHTGVDYAAPEGTPVVALGDGVVIEKGYNNSAGNYIKIKHNSVYTTGYNHFSRFGKGIAKGKRVQQGQVIGYVGKTGYATGPHLDLRFWKNGKPVDPLRVEAPPVEPISPEKLNEYQLAIAKHQARLDSVSPRPVWPQQDVLLTF